MKLAIVSLGSTSSQMTADECKKLFDVVDMLDIRKIDISLGGRKQEVVYDGQPLGQYDCMYVKGSFRYQNVARALTNAFTQQSYMPVRGGAFTNGHDKLLTHLKLQAYNVPMPVTYVAATAAAGKKILKKVNFPVIMKLPSGTHGKGVMFADSIESASSMIDALALLRQPFLIQEYIETDGTDVRVFVVGDKVVAAMRRRAVKGEKRANMHSGGVGEVVKLDAHTQKVAVLAAQALGVEVCGVDILESVKGPLVIEVNISPGLQGITRVTGSNVAEKIAVFLFKKTGEKKGEQVKVQANAIKDLVPDVNKELIVTADFRGNRLLLPEVVSNVTKIAEGDEITLEVNKGKVVIKKG